MVDLAERNHDVDISRVLNKQGQQPTVRNFLDNDETSSGLTVLNLGETRTTKGKTTMPVLLENEKSNPEEQSVASMVEGMGEVTLNRDMGGDGALKSILQALVKGEGSTRRRPLARTPRPQIQR